VPTRDSHESYEDMQALIETVADPGFEERLRAAIRGRGAFRRFKDVLAGYPAEQERWFAFKTARVGERVLEWLADEGIEPVEVIGLMARQARPSFTTCRNAKVRPASASCHWSSTLTRGSSCR
jgi:predicted nucleic acid-binding Zn ribbon protein